MPLVISIQSNLDFIDNLLFIDNFDFIDNLDFIECSLLPTVIKDLDVVENLDFVDILLMTLIKSRFHCTVLIRVFFECCYDIHWNLDFTLILKFTLKSQMTKIKIYLIKCPNLTLLIWFYVAFASDQQYCKIEIYCTLYI